MHLDKAIYYLKKCKIILDNVAEHNGDDDHILPIGGQKELHSIVEALEELIDRTGDFTEHDLG